MPAVFETAKNRAVTGQLVELARCAGNAQPRQQPGQYRQQRHPLAVDFDPEIEREPPTAAFLDFGGPLAAAVDDTVAEAVLDLDPPALAFELRHRVVDKAWPVASSIKKGERNSTTVRGGGAESLDRAQPKRLQPILRRPFGRGIATADDNPPPLDLALLAQRVLATNHGVAIEVAEDRNIDPLFPIFSPNLPIVSAAWTIGEHQCRHWRIFPNLLDQVGSRLWHCEIGQVARDQGAECGGLSDRHRRRRQRDPDKRPRHIECYRTREVLLRVDIPGRCGR